MKTFFHRKLIHRREALGMTQEEMAERLAMANRTYVYLDHGKTCCSGLALALFLIYACEDPVLFLEELRYALEQSNSFAA
jgi:DNA-binding XRE family transcriptional regulator